MFKAGDKVRKKDGSNFSDGTEVAKVVDIIGSMVVLDKMNRYGVNSWISENKIKKVKEKSLEDTAYELGTKSTDNINPGHYKTGGIETIDYLKAKLTKEEFRGYLKGNIVKYISRAELKGGLEDYKKAQWYSNKLIDTEESK
ncbi:MAG TPA: DUF3310 domain-containing protein [Massilibacterium sp.]|nr:DUF3310 domain-containing protein [Massilibacterium sp.]